MPKRSKRDQARFERQKAMSRLAKCADELMELYFDAVNKRGDWKDLDTKTRANLLVVGLRMASAEADRLEKELNPKPQNPASEPQPEEPAMGLQIA